MTVAYDGSLFRYSVFLVLCNRLAAVVFAVSMAIAKGESMKNEAQGVCSNKYYTSIALNPYTILLKPHFFLGPPNLL